MWRRFKIIQFKKNVRNKVIMQIHVVIIQEKKNQKYNEPYPNTKEGCYWLGAKYLGNINWVKLKLKCKGEFLKGKFLMLLMIIFFI